MKGLTAGSLSNPLKKAEKGTRVVITGLGMVLNLGTDKETIWQRMKKGESAFSEVNTMNTEELRCKKAGIIHNDDNSNGNNGKAGLRISKKNQRIWNHVTKVVYGAVCEAIEDADFNPFPYDPVRIGIFMGTTAGNMQTAEAYYKKMIKGEARLRDKKYLLQSSATKTMDLIANELGQRGPRYFFANACSASSTAMAMAMQFIKNGRIDAAICAGYDFLCEITFYGFNALGNTSMSEMAPFSKNRDGLILGEGVGVVVLERYENALNRGAKIYCELAGCGLSADGYDITAPDPDATAASEAITSALLEAGVGAESVDYICAHGTGTIHNDVFETVAIKKVFGEAARTIPVSSIKSMVGHTLGGAGIINAVVSCLAIRDGFIPPTINYQEKDELCDLDYVPNEGRRMDVKTVVSNAFGFGGNNVIHVFRRIEK